MLHSVTPAKAGIPAGERSLRTSPPGAPAFAGATVIAALLLAVRGLAIIPSRRIVVVRRGSDGPGTAFDPAPFVRDGLVALR
jgi:hypothetical protein